MAAHHDLSPDTDLAILGAAFDALKAQVAVLDSTGEIVLVNAGWRNSADHYGLETPNYSIGLSYLAVCDSAAQRGCEEAGLAAAGIRAVLSGDEGEFYLEYPCHGPEAEAWFALRVAPVEHGAERWAVLFHDDISERRRSEGALSESEALYRSVVTAMGEGIVVQEASGEIVTCNRAAEEILGLSFDQMLGRTSTDPRWHAIHEDGSPFPGEMHPAMVTLRTGEPQRNVIMGIRKPDQKLTWISINSQPIPGDEGAVVASFADITERKALEEATRHAQKMEAVGRLAGGIAHDFNNLLTAIMGYGEMALSSLESDHPARKSTEVILETAQRASHLTSKLLTFGRRRVAAPTSVDLNAVVEDLGEMFRRLVAENIEIAVDLEPELGRIEADPTEIEQIVVNLVLNASDAMPDGGRLSISTGTTWLDEAGKPRRRENGADEYVLLRVRDSGKGIPKDLRSKVFEPFFTTKDEGEGTGLGLATIHTIVDEIGGFVDLESESGRGTTFEVFFPRRPEEDEDESTDAADEGPKAVRGTETILLVEDDRVLRDVLSLMLESHGYTVLDASCGEEALERIGALDDAPDLLITDGIMPGMSGRELSDRLMTLRPGLKVLIISGHVGKTLKSLSDLVADAAFLEKPFTPSVLLQRIRELLDHAA